MGKHFGQYFTIWNEAKYTGVEFDPNVHTRYVDGLGAAIYTVGFGLSTDGGENAEAGRAILSKIASAPTMHYDVETAEELTSAYIEIANRVRTAGTGAYVMDQMGENFNLQMGNVTDSKGQMLERPAITVSAYDVYLPNEVGTEINGITVTGDMVGQRKSNTPRAVLETITFNADGTEAYSSRILDANKNPVNILKNGIIEGVYFHYNKNKNTVKNGVVVNGVPTDFPAETIFWKIGEITEQQLELSYYVYLENAMGEDDIGAQAGTSYTNESAVLTYVDINGEETDVELNKPKLTWADSGYSYGFYLVDQNGQPIVGADGKFITVGDLTDVDINLNVDATTDAPNAPSGYVLYDPTASYTVHVNSGVDPENQSWNSGGYWTITDSTDTTYACKDGGEWTKDDQRASTGSFDGTTAWFAVMLNLGIVVDKYVTATDDPNLFDLTLEAYSHGGQITVTNPADLALLQDRFAAGIPMDKDLLETIGINSAERDRLTGVASNTLISFSGFSADQSSN
jgi:hypothetical protein